MTLHRRLQEVTERSPPSAMAMIVHESVGRRSSIS
eukprot:COSAG06_NODE_59845_length_273_cov_0.522989_1_plen_34_part_01